MLLEISSIDVSRINFSILKEQYVLKWERVGFAMAITLTHFLINSLMLHPSKMKWHFSAVVWENPDNTLIYNIFSKLLKVFRRNVYPVELSFKKIALSLPHSTCHTEWNSIFSSITWQQHKNVWSSTPGQFKSSLLCETIPHKTWKESLYEEGRRSDIVFSL